MCTQAISAILTILIIGQQGYTGGINGITDLRTLLGWDIRTDSARYILYFINAVLLMLVVSAGYFIVNSKLGRLMVAIRDKEDRVRFSGYDVANIKTVVFCISALFSAIGGAMFTLLVGFMSPGEVLCWGQYMAPLSSMPPRAVFPSLFLNSGRLPWACSLLPSC